MTGQSVVERACIADVWHRLGGGELDKGRGRAFWRDGDGRNVSVDVERNVWRDFVSGAGGGVLDLIVTVRGGNRAGAAKWLESEFGGDGDIWDASQRAGYARRRRNAETEAEIFVWWKRGFMADREAYKVLADASGDLAWAARGLYLLQAATLGEQALMFRAFRDQFPQETARLIKWGREDLEHCDQVGEAIIEIIAKSQEGEANACAG